MLEVDTERIIQYNFGWNWISGFRGVDYYAKVNGWTTDDRRQVGVKHTDRPCNKATIPPNCLRFE
jgi:hypothetical protein